MTRRLLAAVVCAAGLTALLWAGLVRVFLLHHATWSVNSICHMYGRRPYTTEDESRDNWLVAMVSLGIALVGATVLTVLAWLGLVTPNILLALCFVVGSGMEIWN